MMTQNVRPPAATGDPLERPAVQLTVGDRIAAGFLPEREAAEIVFVHRYLLAEDPWVFVAYTLPGGAPGSTYLRADARIPLEYLADASGLTYSREVADDPTPVSPARVPLHTGFHEAKVAGCE
jgi:hypothetical protein